MISIRLARRTDAAGIARVHERTWKEAYRGLLDSAYLDALSERRLLARWRPTAAQSDDLAVLRFLLSPWKPCIYIGWCLDLNTSRKTLRRERSP